MSLWTTNVAPFIPNLTPGSTSIPGFMVVTLMSLLTSGVAQPLYCRQQDQGIIGYRIVTPQGGVNLDNNTTTNLWYATGDTMLPLLCTEVGNQNQNGPQTTITASPAAVDPSTFTVLFVSADPTYSLVVPYNTWTWTADTSNDHQGYGGWSWFFCSSKYSLSGPNGNASVLGDALGLNYYGTNNNAFDTDRVIAAVYNQFLVNLTPQTAAFQSGLQPPAGPPFQGWLESPYEFGSNASNYSGGSSSAVSNNQVNAGLPLGAYHAIWAISRTTPYSNFACFANGQPNNCDDNQFQFLDVIDATMISQCCAGSGNPTSSGVPNCGQYNGGSSTSPCGPYLSNSTTAASGSSTSSTSTTPSTPTTTSTSAAAPSSSTPSSTTTPSTSAASSPSTPAAAASAAAAPASTTPSSSGGLSTGAIVGIILGSLLVLGLLIAILWLLRKKKQTATPAAGFPSSSVPAAVLQALALQAPANPLKIPGT